MHLVYLDQNAASYLAKAVDGGVWADIRDLLIAGAASNKLLCPMPYETVAESSRLYGPREGERIAIAAFFSKVSRNTATHRVRDLLVREILALVRPWTNVRVIFEYSKNWAEDRNYIRSVKATHEEMLKTIDIAQAAFVTDPNATKNLDQIIFGSLKEQCRFIAKDLHHFLMGDHQNFHVQWMMRSLIRTGLTNYEAQTLFVMVVNGQLLTLGILYWEIVLGSLYEKDTRDRNLPTMKANDLVDLDRMTVACAYFHTIITEKYWAHWCRVATLKDAEKVEIFTLSQAETIRLHFQNVLSC